MNWCFHCYQWEWGVASFQKEKIKSEHGGRAVERLGVELFLNLIFFFKMYIFKIKNIHLDHH
jgi:hypothetical protein